MVRDELKQLFNGKSAYFRDRAPEPLLLPRIASRIAPQDLAYIASSANVLSRFWITGGWPAIADATAEAIARRHTELSDDLLRQLCDELPQLVFALIKLDETAGRRAGTIIGTDAADRLRADIGSSTFVLREVVGRVFDERNPPNTVDDLMVFIRDRSEFEGPELQRNLLAYFLPLAPAMHHGWMVPLLIDVLGTYPDWSVAAAASRVAGLLDQASVEQVEASLECEEPWAGHVRGLLAGPAAGSVFEEVARALPYDDRLESLLASETELASLTGFVDRILEDWGGAPPPKMGASRGWEDEDDGAGPEDMPPPGSVSRGFDPVGMDDSADDAPPASRGMPKSMPSPLPPAAPLAPAAPVPERRLQAQVSVDDDGFMETVSQGFKKGATHDVNLWIGPDSKRSIKSDVALAEPSPDAQEKQAGFMEITITLMHESNSQVQKVKLPVDRTQRSNKAKFSLEVASDALIVSAEIWLQHKGRILQYSKLNGIALDEPFENTQGIEIKVGSVIRKLPDDSSGSEFGMAVVQKDDKYIVFGPTGFPNVVSLSGSSAVVADLSGDIFRSTQRLVRKFAQDNGTGWVEEQNEEALKLLRKMATRGNQFYDELKKQNVLEHFSETIQFVNLDKNDIVPIEYVYDKGYPQKGATLCEGFSDNNDWNEIFASGQCTCSNKPGIPSDSICPMGFWSLSKVIERQTGSSGMTASTETGTAQPSAAAPAIALDRFALLAAAPNVNAEDVESIEKVLAETYPNRYTYAKGWDKWEAEIARSSPKLLVLLPHHGEEADGDTNFLEISSAVAEQGSKLFSGTLHETHVSMNPDEPGPIVLLLGCETAQPGLLPYSRFARDFLANRASIVVGTQSSVLGRHAAEVANEFIRQLLSSAGGGESFGRIMRNVRQKMFSSGFLMSLTLVSFGDADWKLENSTTGENDVSH